MGKLNVVIPVADVEVNGVKYRRVDRPAQEGDIIKFTEAPTSYVSEGFYLVDELDSCGDPQITDDDGDNYDACNDDYEVYEKVAPQYREVKRNAEVGERIRIVNTIDCRWDNGEEFVVDGDALGGDVFVKHPEGKSNGRAVVNYSEYVVLEPVEQAEQTQPKRLTVGDYAKITDVVHGHKYNIGEIVKIVTDDGSTLPYVGETHDKRSVGAEWFAPSECLPATEAEFNAQKPQPKQLQVGDYAKVIDASGDSSAKADDIVKIESEDSSGGLRLLNGKTFDGREIDMFAQRFVRATESEVEAAKKAAERAKAIGEFADGGYAVVVDVSKGGLNGFNNGDYVPVEYSHDDGQWTYLRVKKGSLYGFCNADALRKVTKEEYEEATKPKPKFNVGDKIRITRYQCNWPEGTVVTITEPDVGGARKTAWARSEDGRVYLTDYDSFEVLTAEEAKWAKIERKVNEFKAGDVVRVIKSCPIADTRVGDVTTIERLGGHNGVYLTQLNSGGSSAFIYADEIELIVPVEQRFDTQQEAA
ncbi:hypothetical protein RJP21_04940 [Paenibacillus sp. VCA1]|uniref:hypothetical protein n=1 Tax=Paenibacillus sp. VCA1 TaxID=3039148 RepID=UPI002870B82E|nr:hypothetical protein [Paenibacillus sp. VCA1]MDR9852945.1 hypothetical protein [Paenibacillus sp. VCA1]